MYQLFSSLRPFIRRIVNNSGLVVALAALLAVAAGFFAVNLRVDSNLAALLPSDYPSVQAIEELRETVGGESDAAVAIVSPSFEANKAFAEALIPEVLKLQGESYGEPYFTHAEYYRDIAFLENNALYFATPAELDRLEGFLEDEIRRVKLEANPFYVDLGLEEDSTEKVARELENTYDRIVGQEYPVSDDSTTMVLRFYPSGAQTDIGFIEDAYEDLEALAASLGPAEFHPEMEVVLAGRLYRQLVEVRTITRDVASSFGAGVLAVLLVVALYFFYKSYRARAGRQFDRKVFFRQMARAPLMAAVIGVPLLMSLTWTFGVTYLLFETLNVMTATLGLVLFGLGIDFGIHIYARYAEERGTGCSVIDSIEHTFATTGQAVTTGALTTAAALFVLGMADFKGFSEFGIISGMGIIFALVGMMVVLPALLALLEHYRWLHLEANAPHAALAREPSRRPFPAARWIIAGSLVALVASLILLPVDFEYDFGSLEPDYTAYDARNAVINRVDDNVNGRNPAYILLDDRAETEAVVKALRSRAAQDTLSPTIDRVVSLQERFPFTEEGRRAKLGRLADIRDLLGGKYLGQDSSESLQRLRMAAQTTEALTLEDIPAFLRKRFTSKQGDVGHFVMVYPSVGLSDGRMSIAFAEDVGAVTTAAGETYHAGSTSLVAADMLSLMRREAPWMIAFTFLVVAGLMWFSFRKVRLAALAMAPLVVGILWMLLVMEMIGLKLNFYNLVVLPAILGIGEDAGVHIVHRYEEEGPGSIRKVLRSTGEHVTMCTITTIIGFAGLLLSFHPGLRSIGLLAVVGLGTTLLASLTFLPAMIQWLEEASFPGNAYVEAQSTSEECHIEKRQSVRT